MLGDNESLFELLNLISLLNQTLRVQVSLRSDSLIERLLLLQLCLVFRVGFLELDDQVTLDSALFDQLGDSVGVLLGILSSLISFLFEFEQL